MFHIDHVYQSTGAYVRDTMCALHNNTLWYTPCPEKRCHFIFARNSAQARIQDFLTRGVDCRGVPPFSLPFPPFPSASLLPPPHPFPLPPFP